jgi:putative Holliday junction resolvase
MDGSLGPRSQSAKDFAQNITKITKIPITLWDERLSSEGAFKLMGDLNINSSKKSEKLDQHAAAFILQGYLDFLNK